MIFPEGWDLSEIDKLPSSHMQGRKAYEGEDVNRFYGDVWLLEQVAAKVDLSILIGWALKSSNSFISLFRSIMGQYDNDNYIIEVKLRDNVSDDRWEPLYKRSPSIREYKEYHCCPEKFYHNVSCPTEPASGTTTGTVG